MKRCASATPESSYWPDRTALRRQRLRPGKLLRGPVGSRRTADPPRGPRRRPRRVRRSHGDQRLRRQRHPPRSACGPGATPVVLLHARR